MKIYKNNSHLFFFQTGGGAVLDPPLLTIMKLNNDASVLVQN